MSSSGSNDSVHVGLDGQAVSTSDRMQLRSSSWQWSKKTLDGSVATIQVSSKGLHAVNVWIREDGFIIDKLVLTTSASYTPSGTGPGDSSTTDNTGGLSVANISGGSGSTADIGSSGSTGDTGGSGTATNAYIAWEPYTGTINGMAIDVARTGNTVTDSFYTMNFNRTFSTAPVFLADMQTTDGGDTANLRWQNKGSASVSVQVDEEQSQDSETSHTTEVVGYIAIR